MAALARSRSPMILSTFTTSELPDKADSVVRRSAQR